MPFGKELTSSFELNEHDKEVYFRAFLYFIQDPRFENLHPSYKLNKGLFINGPTGVGKSLLFDVFKKLIRSYNINNDFGIFKTIDVVGNYSIEGYKIIINHSDESFFPTNGYTDKSKPRHRLYDDLGSEEQFSSYFGNKLVVMENILMKRYDYFISHKMKTHITTNLNKTEIDKIYGRRITSRLRQMVNVIYYPGVDRRK